MVSFCLRKMYEFGILLSQDILANMKYFVRNLLQGYQFTMAVLFYLPTAHAIKVIVQEYNLC